MQLKEGSISLICNPVLFINRKKKKDGIRKGIVPGTKSMNTTD